MLNIAKLDEFGRFVIEDYNRTKPFASFLPGIAGFYGIPLWVFYVNRGQCVTSFGVLSKDKPILEFHPAFRALQLTQIFGFRTFLLVNGEFYEPLNYQSATFQGASQRMYVGKNELELVEVNKVRGIEVRVQYFTLPNESIAALVRMVTLRNISNSVKRIEALDGLANILPTGINDYVIKHMGNTIRAWMDVYNLDSKIPIFRLRSSTEDTARVEEIRDGNFYASLVVTPGHRELTRPIVDPVVVFGNETSYTFPEIFANGGLDTVIKAKQHTTNKIACAFTPVQALLYPGESVEIFSAIGYVTDEDKVQRYFYKFNDKEFYLEKYQEARMLVEELTSVVETNTREPVFDEYTKQTYLDNVLRGGYPLVFSEGRCVYHVFSRKHGDLERDYNYFVLLPEYFSSGNGNYRDVNQNRRNDVFFNPAVGAYNIKFFMNLIQIDGYNPLVINGVRYKATSETLRLIDELAQESQHLKDFLSKQTFTPGKIATFLEREGIKLNIPVEEFIKNVIATCEEEIDAVHGEGFWTDHWTYNLDLIESYLELFPEEEERLLFEDEDYTYYDNPHVVLPRQFRYVLSGGKVRQYYSVIEDPEKKRIISSRNEYKNVVRTKHGTGEIYKTNLMVKLLNLAAIKFATLDPDGIGIEMEAGKPGWYDALNGLPGLFGSSVAESFELLRLLNFILNILQKHSKKSLKLPIEVKELIDKLSQAVMWYEEIREAIESKDFVFWSVISEIREDFRERTKLGFDGAEVQVTCAELIESFERFRRKLSEKLEMAIKENGGIPPTYFYYEPVDYEIIGDAPNSGEKYVNVKKFQRKEVPLFLEGIVKVFKVYEDREFLRDLHAKVRNSQLYDKKLKMYKVNAPLENASIEIGRARAFTPGWLENESIWLHMEYKYMLELIKSGLYEEFFSDFKNVFIPFLNPYIYGRSILENCSFIVSSANPDETLHGNGFVARLTGATAEFLSIWRIMFVGRQPFKVNDGQIILEFKPILPGWLFDENGTISFKFLGSCNVIYHNPQKIDTYKTEGPRRVVLHIEGHDVTIEGGFIPEPYSKMVRSGQITTIEVFF